MSIKKIQLLFLFLLGFTTSFSQTDESEKHAVVAMRLIGHEILLSSNDYTTLVLPIEVNGDQYKISFDNDFVFDPFELTAIVDSIMETQKISSNYLVEVKQCETRSITYSYEVGEGAYGDMQTCMGREFPKDCYYIEINNFDHFEELLGADVAVVEDSSRGLQIFAAIALGISLLMMIWYQIRKRQRANVNPDLIMIGKYLFDKRNLELSYKNEKIELSHKEADLLNLLYTSVNNTLKRESILRIVWGDEGVYVGRTLDVFISKLRKKLESDEKVKIVNVRGVGYKLVV
ncbi:MAG: hypothetical protein ACI857_002529 [Arenicella sp.]|jgi:hypothetical protein